MRNKLTIGTNVSAKKLLRAVLAAIFALCLCEFADIEIAGAQNAAAQEAQRAPETVPDAPSKPAVRIAGWNETLNSIDNAIAREGITDEELIALSADAARIQANALSLANELQPRIDRLEQQLAELGDAPQDGQAAETSELRDRRDQLRAELSVVDGLQREARLVAVRVQQIENALLAKRQQRFFERITQRGPPPFSPALWSPAFAELPDYLGSLGLQLRDSIGYASRQFVERPVREAWFVVELILLIIIFGSGWRWLHRRAKRAEAEAEASPYKDWTARGRLQEIGASGLIPAAGLVVLRFRLEASSLLPERTFQLVATLLDAAAVLIILLALLHVFVNPGSGGRRIAAISDVAAKRIWAAVSAGLIAIIALRVLEYSARQLIASNDLIEAIAVLVTIVGLVTGIFSLLLVSRDLRSGAAQAVRSTGVLNWRNLSLLFWLAAILGAVALISGYIEMAQFVLLQAVLLSLVGGFLWLLLRLIEELKERVLANGPEGEDKSGYVGRQFAVLGFGFVKLVLVLFAISTLLAPWGIQSQDWTNMLRSGFFGFQVGGLRISFSAILTAIALFVIGIIATGQIRNWFSTQYLPTTRMDRGLRNSITTIIGYAGIILSALLAVTAAGFNLSSIALVAGALSVGIGLGLQSIVNNFVSGLILLAERPIKSGDWVVTSGGQGTVKRIAVRSTEIETFDGATVIVPNSNLITESVTNWTHRDSLGRITVAVGVSYASDPEEVRDILDECARANPLVLAEPAHQILFMDYGADALQFELRAYLGDIGYCLPVASDLRFAILKAFRERGIEIPFPQRDLHIRSGLDALRQPQAQTQSPLANPTRETPGTGAVEQES